MSDLSDLAEELTKDLPIGARKAIDKALECGWELNKPGMTVVLRLNHPSDELAEPVYVCWSVRKTPSGKVGFSFDSCGTRGLHSLRPAELLDYLEDPSSAYILEEDGPEGPRAARDEFRAKGGWDDRATPAQNLRSQLGAVPVRIETEPGGRDETAAEILARARKMMEAKKCAGAAPSTPQAGSTPPAQPQPTPPSAPRSPARPLRVSL